MNWSKIISPLHRAWQLIPPRSRRSFLFFCANAFAPRAQGLPIPAAGPIQVAGFFRTASGLGESARLCHRALSSLGYQTEPIDLSGTFLMQGVDLPAERMANRGCPGDGVLIVHAAGSTMGLTLLTIGRRNTRNKRIIGYLAWELPDLPPIWRKGLQFLDELWVPSRFVAEAVVPHTDKLVRIVPHPVAVPRIPSREHLVFHRPENTFVVLTAFNMASGFRRKNPLAAVRAFKAAFGASRDCLLVLKIEYPDSSPQEMSVLIDEIGGSENIVTLHRTLSSDEMAGLIAESDVVLSLHRSEGFGLILAEAMLLRKPVIATGWSGNIDFMSARNSMLVAYDLVPTVDPSGGYDFPDQEWAEPSVESAAEALRALKDDPELRMSLAEAAGEDSTKYFSLDEYGRRIEDGLPSKPLRRRGDT